MWQIFDGIILLLSNQPYASQFFKLLYKEYMVLFCSDQFDPFNRAPLTMDMVIPQPELRDRIKTWLEDWKKKHAGPDDVTTLQSQDSDMELA